MPERIDCDILVLGTGIAGLYTTLKAGALGRTILLTKKKLADSSTEFAQGGIAAAIAPGDSPSLHLEDTVAAGDGLCDLQAVRVLVEEGPECVRELATYGVRFDMVGEDFELTREGAHSRRRILHAGGDATGEEIRRGLERHVRADHRITVHEEEFAVDLLMDGGRCYGALVLGRDGRLRAYRARAVVLATGGAGQLYRHSTNPDVATGDGIAMAYRAGATVKDMEFIQFHPTALYIPNPPPGRRRPRPRVLISEAVRGEGAILLNVRGRRFMPSYHPQAELAPRDVVARAIAQEMEKTASAYVLLDARPIGAAFPTRFPTIYEKCRRHGIDPLREPIPVAPAAHYIMGGVRTDLWGRTDIPGLYACGEAACTGVHGANRLASNSLLEGVVFGRRIARALAEDLPALAAAPAPACGQAWTSPLLQARYNMDTAAAWRSVQLTMWRKAGLYRDESGLGEALEFLRELAADLGLAALPPAAAIPAAADRPPRGVSPPSRTDLELANLVTVAGLAVRSALERRESRGAHFRTDYPARNDEVWRKHIIIMRGCLDFEPLR